MISANDLILFHGTLAKHVPAIEANGLHPPDSVMMPASWFMLTTSRDQAAGYTGGRADAVVLEFRVPANLVYARGTADAVLWPGQAHDVYGYPATAYAVRGALPSAYLVACTPVATS